MSATVMGAVMRCGPMRVRLRLALAGIADNADDFGFALLSMATIASKSLCDERTAIRVVQELERERWLTVHRRVVDGKGSVYVVNVDKLGIVPDQKSRKSPWHVAFDRGTKLREVPAHDTMPPVKRQNSGDKMSPELAGKSSYDPKSLRLIDLKLGRKPEEESGDILSPEFCDSPFLSPESGDNSQGVQVTFSGGSGDILPVAILKNHRTIKNPDVLPPTPFQGDVCETLPGDPEPAQPCWGDAWNPIPEELEAEWRGWWEGAERYRAREGHRPVPWEQARAESLREYARHHPPKPAPDSAFARCVTALEAAGLVMRRCSLMGDSLAPVIAAAIALALVNQPGSVAEMGERAWQSYTLYQGEVSAMKFRWGVRKFFREGHWLNPETWPREAQKRYF